MTVSPSPPNFGSRGRSSGSYPGLRRPNPVGGRGSGSSRQVSRRHGHHPARRTPRSWPVSG